jgi:hypothetical protein
MRCVAGRDRAHLAQNPPERAKRSRSTTPSRQRVQILHKRRGCAVDASDLLAGLAPQEVLAFRKSRISDKINS